MESNEMAINYIKNLCSSCTKLQTKTFPRGSIITTYIEKRNQFCILLEGEADLVRYDFNGNKTIIEHLMKNDIFGETFSNVTNNNELSVVARSKCSVLQFDYDEIQTPCQKNCTNHTNLYSNIVQLILNKTISQNTRIEMLTKRSIREKLLSYFGILSSHKFSKTFTLPFSLTDLSDYLSVDRSAMMRELKLLQEDGFIVRDGNKITLLIY